MDVAGSAVGIAALGIQICQGLLSYYDGWKDYEADTAGTRESIKDLSDTLSLLKETLESGGLDERRKERIKDCLESCTSGLAELSKRLDELRKHEKPQGLRQKARAELQKAWYPFRKETLTRLRSHVADVRGRLKLAIQVLQLAVQKSDRFRNLTNWLSAPDPWTNHHSARQRCEPQTGTWFLQSDLYNRWKAGDVSHLWLYGKAGCGKSILSSTAIEDVRELCEQDLDVGFAIFYFSFSDSQKQSYETLLRSLVAQLGWNEPGYSMLQNAYEKPHRPVPGVDDLEKILLAVISSFRKVMLILDALDESPEDHDIRHNMLEQIERLAQNNIKILVTSRDIRDVRESMEALTAEQLPIATSTVNADIRRYLSTQLSRDRRLSRLDPQTKSLIEDTISKKADGMFRWAYCQVQELKKLKSTKRKYIEDALRTLPATLDETYERMLSGIEKRYFAEAFTLLRWLSYARSPPTLRELAEAAIIDPEAEVPVDTGNRGRPEDTLDILSALVVIIPRNADDCQSNKLSDVDDSDDDDLPANLSFSDRSAEASTQVRLAHFSVKEYLESKRILDSNARYYHLDSVDGHRFIARSCVAYLMFWSNDPCKSSTEQDLEAYPLLDYAASTWYHHFRQQNAKDVKREVALLCSNDMKRDWLLVHDPEDTTSRPFTQRRAPGSGVYYASVLGLEAVMQALLDADAEVDIQEGMYCSALYAAARHGKCKIVGQLLEHGAEPDAPGGNDVYGDPLLAAVSSGHGDIANLLLATGASIGTKDEIYKHALLHAASRAGLPDIVKLLLKEHVIFDPNGSDFGVQLEAALKGGNSEIIDLLLDAGTILSKRELVYGDVWPALECIPSPPRWLISIIEMLRKHHPDGNFIPVMRPCCIDSLTGERARQYENLQPGDNLPAGHEMIVLSKILCLDSPGKLYITSPGWVLLDFEVHLRNRGHEERLQERLKREAQTIENRLAKVTA